MRRAFPVLAAALGAFLGLGLSLASSCGQGPSCGFDTCATGCCTDEGRCRPGTESQACGTRGNTCAQCLVGRTCREQACR